MPAQSSDACSPRIPAAASKEKNLAVESLHPVTVHFPIALLVTALLVETLAIFLKRPAWHRISLWNLVLGTLATIAAVMTGRLAMAVAKHSMEIYRTMTLHSQAGFLALGLAAVVAGWRLATGDRLGRRSRKVAWLLLAIACGIIAFGAHLGGRLVYEFGVGGVYGRSGGIQVQ